MSNWPSDDPVSTARIADCLAWSREPPSSRRNALLVRDEAVRQALTNGVPAEQIAEVLHVRTADVDRMARRPEPA